MTHAKRLPAIVLIVIMMLSIIPASAMAAKQQGWEKNDDGKWTYYEDGVMIKNQWFKIGGKWYYFYSDGSMAASTIVPDDEGKNFYIVEAGGAMITKAGWTSLKITTDGETYTIWFYLKKGGAATIGWKKISKKWYYFAEFAGIMINGEICPEGFEIEGEMYFFNKDGSLKTKSWVKNSDGYWYYLDKDGKRVTGWQKISKKWYYFEAKEKDYMYVMYSGWWLNDPEESNKWYYFSKNGVMVTNDWVEDIDEDEDKTYWYYQGADGLSVMGWKKISGKWYYFDPQDYGACVMGTYMQIGNKWYQFDKNGVCVNPSGSDTGPLQ